jgi:hypothetical protein
MVLRPRRRNLVVWTQSVGSARRYPVLRLTRTGRLRRCLRIAKLLTLIGLLRLARVVRPRWKLLLAGTVLTVTGIVLRSSSVGSAVLLPGLLFLFTAPLIPASLPPDYPRRRQLERELAAYSTPAQRRDLEATLDRYPDGIASELRDILATQAVARRKPAIPGGGPH